MTDNAAGGWCAIIDYGGGESVSHGLATALRNAAGGTGSVADDSINSVMAAVGKTYKRARVGAVCLMLTI